MNRVYDIKTNAVTNRKTTQAVIEFYPEGAPSWQDLQLFSNWSNIPFSNFSNIIGPFEAADGDGEVNWNCVLIQRVSKLFLFFSLVSFGHSAVDCCCQHALLVHHHRRRLGLRHGPRDFLFARSSFGLMFVLLFSVLNVFFLLG